MNDKQATTQDSLDLLLGAGVDHVILVNEMGRIESAASNSELALSKEKQEIFSMGFRLHHSLMQEFDCEFGPVEHFVISRKNTKIMSIPFGSKILIFVMDNMSDHDAVVRQANALKDRSLTVRDMNPLYAEAVQNG